MRVAKGYKQTELGEIPDDWHFKTFGEVMKGFSSGQTPSRSVKKYFTGKIPWITSGELNYNAITDTVEKITEEATAKTRLKVLPVGTFLMAITGLEAEGTRGSCGITGVPATTNQSCMALYPNDGELTTAYLYQFYVQYGNSLAFKYCQGTKQQSFTGKIAKTLPIIFPPTVEEQNAITNALNETDAFISDLEKLIQKKQNIKQATMQVLLTGKKRVKGFKGEWEIKKLGDISKIKTGKRNNEENEENGVYPFFVRSQTVKRISTYSFDGEAILVPGEGGIGSIIHYIKGRFDFHQRVYKISDFATNVCGKFIYFHMLQNFHLQATKNSVKATVDSLRLPTFQNYEIPIPQQLEEQEAIANILNDIEAEIELLKEQLSKYKSAKQGMMQNLLTGKTRLV